MNYFLLRHEYPNSGYIDGDVIFTPPFATYYRVGEPLEADQPLIAVTMDKSVRKLKADFFLTTSGAFFASDELSELLTRYEASVRVVPADTRYSGGKSTEKRFWLVHTNDRLPAFDYERSQYAGKELSLRRLECGESPGSFLVKGVQSVVIDENRAAGHHFFFLKNVLLIDPIVSGDLAQAIRERNLNVVLDVLSS